MSCLAKIIVSLLALAATACTSRLSVQDITYQPEGVVAGLPFRAAEGYTLRIYQRQADGTYTHVHHLQQQLPNPDRLYSLAFDAQRLADNTLDVTFNVDGTLSLVKLTTAQRADEAFDAFGDQLTGLAKEVITAEDQQRELELKRLKEQAELEAARNGLEDARQTRVGKPQSDLEAAQKAALEALTAAEVAAEALAALPEDASSQVVATAKGALRLSRLLANQAFRRAGLPEPFPGILPQSG